MRFPIKHRRLGAVRALSLLVVFCAGAGSAQGNSSPLPAPGERGSHKHYADALKAEEERLKAEALSRYDRAVAESPHDPVVAIERCAFLRILFSDTEVEWEEELDPRQPQLAACIADLENRFSTDPNARVFAIESRWGSEAVKAARRYFADTPATAEARHHAAVHAHLAKHLSSDESDDALEHAEKAMALDPSIDLRLSAARNRIEIGDRQGAKELLLGALETTKDQFTLESKAALLADLQAFDAAIMAFEEVQRRGGTPNRSLDFARALAGVGRIEEARQLYAAASVGWTSTESLRARFEFECAHGSPQSAREAYDGLREQEWDADLFGQARLALLLAHPTARWRWWDLTGLLGLIAAGMSIAMIPAFVIVSVYAVGLLKRRSSQATVFPGASFGLRHAWMALAAIALAESFALFVYPAALEPAGKAMQAKPELAGYMVLSGTVSFLGALLVVRAKVVELFARGTFGWRRTILIAVLIVVGVRLLIVALAWATGGDAKDPDASELIVSIQRGHGLGVSLIYLALLTPITEEIVFRGVLLPAFGTRLRPGMANAAQALLFGLFHVHPIRSAALFVFGLVAGRLTRSSGSLWPALWVHVLNNVIACVAVAWLDLPHLATRFW